MDTLVFMNAPSAEAIDARRRWAIQFLTQVKERDPDITWEQLYASIDQLVAGQDPNQMDGWLTNAMRAVTGALDTVTFGGASKVFRGVKDIVSDVFDKKKVADSLKEAGEGVASDALDRFIDSLPFGLGKDLKSGYVFNKVWPLLLVGVVVLVLFVRKKRR